MRAGFEAIYTSRFYLLHEAICVPHTVIFLLSSSSAAGEVKVLSCLLLEKAGLARVSSNIFSFSLPGKPSECLTEIKTVS